MKGLNSPRVLNSPNEGLPENNDAMETSVESIRPPKELEKSFSHFAKNTRKSQCPCRKLNHMLASSAPARIVARLRKVSGSTWVALHFSDLTNVKVKFSETTRQAEQGNVSHLGNHYNGITEELEEKQTLLKGAMISLQT